MPLYSLAIQASTLDTSSVANSLTSNVLVGGTAKLIAPSNASRKQLTVFNSNSGIVYFGYDNMVSATNYSFKLSQDGYFESPVPVFTGNIYAFCASNNALSVTEFV